MEDVDLSREDNIIRDISDISESICDLEETDLSEFSDAGSRNNSDDTLGSEDDCCSEELGYENKSCDAEPTSKVTLKKVEVICREVLNLGVIGCKIDKKPVGSGWSAECKAPSLEQLGSNFARDIERKDCQAIGLLCGRAFDLLCIDLDMDKVTDNKVGQAMYRLLFMCKAAGAVIQHTPGGGFHALFRFPLGYEFHTWKNKAASNSPLLICDGVPLPVDVRSDGGYFCVAPSAVIKEVGAPPRRYYLEGKIEDMANRGIVSYDIERLFKHKLITHKHGMLDVDFAAVEAEKQEKAKQLSPEALKKKNHRIAEIANVPQEEVDEIFEIAYKLIDPKRVDAKRDWHRFIALLYRLGAAWHSGIPTSCRQRTLAN